MNTQPTHTLEDAIGNTQGTFCVCAKDLSSGKTLELAADAVTPTASCIKLFILIELARRIDERSLHAHNVIPLARADHVGGSGVLRFMVHEAHMTLEDVAMFMIALSDNTATNLLIDTLGIHAINATAQRLGCNQTVLHNRIDFDAIGTDVGNFATSTARDFVRALELVACEQLFSPAASRFVWRILATQQYLDLLPRYTGFNPYAQDLGITPTITIANKTGFFPGFRGDVAIMQLPSRTIVVAAFAQGLADTGFQIEHEGARALGRIGQCVIEAFCP